MKTGKLISGSSALLVALFSLISGSHRGEGKAMPPDQVRIWIKEVFTKVVEDMNAKEATYLKYFSQNYVQQVDGKTLTLKDFIEHMKAQKQVMKKLKVNFKYILVEGNNVATVHVVEGTKRDGSPIKVQVNAFFRLQGQKIELCDELTRIIQGSKGDEDLGSRR